MFTGVLYNVTGYESIHVMILAQICTGQRCLPVCHWVTVALLMPFLCARNVGDALSVMCMQPLL